MTQAQLSTASKATLLEYVGKLQQENIQAKADVQTAISIANHLSSIVGAIELILAKAPFLNKDGKFFKKVFWVISNFAVVKQLIEEVVEAIKDWKEKIHDILKPKAAEEAAQ